MRYKIRIFFIKLNKYVLSVKAIDSLVTCSEGDLRKAITFMQCAARLKANECIKSSDILEIAGILNDKVIINILDRCAQGSFEKVESCVQVIIVVR